MGLDGKYTQLLKDGFPMYSGFSDGLSVMQIPPLDLRQVELIKGSSPRYMAAMPLQGSLIYFQKTILPSGLAE